MSSYSYHEVCPNCGNEADACLDSRDGEFMWCPHCGLHSQPNCSQVDLATLNEWRMNQRECIEDEVRAAQEWPLLQALPKWNLCHAEDPLLEEVGALLHELAEYKPDMTTLPDTCSGYLDPKLQVRIQKLLHNNPRLRKADTPPAKNTGFVS